MRKFIYFIIILLWIGMVFYICLLNYIQKWYGSINKYITWKQIIIKSSVDKKYIQINLQKKIYKYYTWSISEISKIDNKRFVFSVCPDNRWFPNPSELVMFFTNSQKYLICIDDLNLLTQQRTVIPFNHNDEELRWNPYFLKIEWYVQE